MPAVTLVHDMDANQETVWNAWADFGNIAEFHPGLKGSRIIRGPETGQGATRVCEQQDGTEINERITVFEPHSKIGWVLENPPKPLKEGVVTVKMDNQGPGKTRVTMEFEVKMGMGPLGPIIYNLVAKNMITKNLTKVLSALNKHLTEKETAR
ncbi:MAG: hypothetical protein CMF39_05485 [Legionellaceae bacterium]|nr:hypothetical protein [Legionellaceae bacterium]|tara:strand:- start:15 stop:473 length:459 start_codon:yes stop_codon:yes gene_type:complete